MRKVYLTLYVMTDGGYIWAVNFFAWNSCNMFFVTEMIRISLKVKKLFGDFA